MAGPDQLGSLSKRRPKSVRFTLMADLTGRALLRVFLCHSSGDKPAVRSLYKKLGQDNFRPWLDEEDLIPGQDWAVEIARAVRASDIVVVCLSRSSITKEGFVQKEIRQALDVADEKPEGAIFIIPLRLEDCEVPERLRRWHWVNLFDSNGYDKLFLALRRRQGPQENGPRADGADLRPEQHGGNRGVRTSAEERGGPVPAKSTERPEIQPRPSPREKEGRDQTSVSSQTLREPAPPSKTAGTNPIKKAVIVGGLALVGFLLLGLLLSPYLDTQADGTKVTLARAQIGIFATALANYKLDTGTYPTTEQGLRALHERPAGVTQWAGPYIKNEILKDPWGHDLGYKFPGEHGEEPDIVCLGAHGAPGGEGSNADIVSWAHF